MPTIIIKGYKFRFYSSDINEPPHIHVLRDQNVTLVDNEQEIRQNISSWVEQIHQTADLSPEAEQRLLMVMTQFIEEKFKTLNYEELCKMLKLTPFEETTTFVETYQRKLQKDLQIYSIEKLIKQIKRKFKFAERTLAKLDARLRKLTLQDLSDLFEAIFDLSTLRDLNAWINARLPTHRPHHSSRYKYLKTSRRDAEGLFISAGGFFNSPPKT